MPQALKDEQQRIADSLSQASDLIAMAIAATPRGRGAPPRSARDLAGALSSVPRLLDSDPDNAELSTRARDRADGGRQWPAEAADVAGPASVGRRRRSGAAVRRLAICQVAAGRSTRGDPHLRNARSCRSPGRFHLRLAYAEWLERQGDAAAALPEYFRAVHDAQRHGRWLDDATHAASAARTGQAGDGPDRRRSPGAVRARVAATRRRVRARRHGARRRGTAVYLGTQRPPAARSAPAAEILLDAGPARDAVLRSRQCSTGTPTLEAAAADIREELQAACWTRERELTPFLVIDDKMPKRHYLGGDPHSRAWDAFFFHRHGAATCRRHLPPARGHAAALESGAVDAHRRTRAGSAVFGARAADPHQAAPRGHQYPGRDAPAAADSRRATASSWSAASDMPGIRAGASPSMTRSCTRPGTAPTTARRADPGHLESGSRAEECVALKDLVERIGDFNARAGIS